MDQPQSSDQISLERLITDDSLKHDASTDTEPNARMTLSQALRRWPKVTLYSLLLTSCIILWGYDGVLSGSVASMPAFLAVYGERSDSAMEYIIPSTWLSLWGVASGIGSMPGALAAGWISDKIGRTRVLGICTVLSAIAVVGFICSDLSANIEARRGMFFGSKIFSGFAIGGLQTIIQTWMSEAVPQQLRGSLLPIIPVFILIGNILGTIVVQVQIDRTGREAYRIALGTIWVFSVLSLVTSLVLPESPAWLLRKGRIDKASKAHKRLEYSKRYPSAHIRTFAALQSTTTREQRASNNAGGATYLDCFKGTNLRRTFIVCFCNVLPELFGMSLLGSAGYFLQTVGVTASTANYFFMAGIGCALLGISSTFFTLARFGRRQLILPTLGAVSLLWGSMGVIGTIKSAPGVIIWWSAICMTLVITTASLGVWPASFVVGAETSALRLRAKTQGLAWSFGGAFGAIFQFGVPYIYNPDAGALGAQTGYVFFGFTMIALAISFFFLPEMKGRTAPEIDQLFEERVPARLSRQWQGSRGDYTPLKHSRDQEV